MVRRKSVLKRDTVLLYGSKVASFCPLQYNKKQILVFAKLIFVKRRLFNSILFGKELSYNMFIEVNNRFLELISAVWYIIINFGALIVVNLGISKSKTILEKKNLLKNIKQTAEFNVLIKHILF